MLASASAVCEGCMVGRILTADAQSLYDALNLFRGVFRRALGLSPEFRKIS